MTKDAISSVLLIDDHPLISAGNSTTIYEAAEKSHVISAKVSVATAFNYADGLKMLTTGDYDAAVVDVNLHENSGLDLVREAISAGVTTRFIFFTAVADPRVVIEAESLGAFAVVLKSGRSADLITALESAGNGLHLLSEKAVAAAAQEVAELGLLDDTELSDREKSIVELVADGATDKEIAAKLFVSNATVRNSLSKIYAKLELAGRAELQEVVWRGRKLKQS